MCRVTAANVSVPAAGVDPGFVRIGGNGDPAGIACGVPGANGEAAHIVVGHPSDGPQHVDLPVPEGPFAQVERRFHGQQAQQLEQVVLDHVAEGAGRVVVAGATLEGEGLVPDDVDTLDVLGVPHGLEDPVGEAEPQDVLHGLLAEEVIDPEDVLLAHDFMD